MEYDQKHVKQQLSFQGIEATDEDVHYVQRVLSMIRHGESKLEAFPDIEKEKIILTQDMEG